MWLWYGMYIYIVLVVIRQKPEHRNTTMYYK
jgi:hypothetical protein